MPSIFLLRDREHLVEMPQQPYESEALLQQLLATHPGVLAGDQFGSVEPRRWLLVCRETGVPSENAGADRWSLDHLFVDQDGIPTLVEVKRSSDTRIRREVVGQMLDYAANAVAYWPAGQVRSRFEETCEREHLDPVQRLCDFLGKDLSEPGADNVSDSFWKNVDTNLRAGCIRMVFVSDMIPTELRRIVEFLNAQMSPAEVLAIEIKQFVGSGITTLVPSVIGQTAQAAARRTSATAAASEWDLSSFLQQLRARKGDQGCAVAKALFQWCDRALPLVWWGHGKFDGSCYRGFLDNGIKHFLFAVWTYGKIEIPFTSFGRAPFNEQATRLELLRRLNEVHGITFPPDAISRRPAFDLMLLADAESESKFRAAIEWAISMIQAEPPPAAP